MRKKCLFSSVIFITLLLVVYGRGYASSQDYVIVSSFFNEQPAPNALDMGELSKQTDLDQYESDDGIADDYSSESMEESPLMQSTSYSYYENFNANVIGKWQSYGNWWVESGAYKSDTYNQSGTAQQSYYEQMFGSATIEGWVNKVSGSSQGWYNGLLFNLQFTPAYGRYLFVINPSGYYCLWKNNGSSSGDYLIAWTYSSAINEGYNAWNKLKVVVAGSSIKLYINDIYIAEYYDSAPLGSGFAGLMSLDADGREVNNYDDFSINGNKVFTAGWSSATGYKWANTAIRRNIVSVSSTWAALTRKSGQSKKCNRSDACWETDIADGDGQRIRSAITIYDQWKRGTASVGKTEAQITELMKARLTTYITPKDVRGQIVNRIKNVYTTNTSVPSDDASTLKYLGIQKQCLEWAMTVALSSGGKAKNYSAGSVGLANVRPGMGYYHAPSHAMIIVDVHYSSSGVPDKLRVAESNWCGSSPYPSCSWINPVGQVPWNRIITPLREITNLGYAIIDYDR